jgi:hypothetical protein
MMAKGDFKSEENFINPFSIIIVVERGNTLGGPHVIRSAFGAYFGDQLDDRFLGRTVVPRWQQVGLGRSLLNQGWDESEGNEKD